jgi:hypothetical protein
MFNVEKGCVVDLNPSKYEFVCDETIWIRRPAHLGHLRPGQESWVSF